MSWRVGIVCSVLCWVGCAEQSSVTAEDVDVDARDSVAGGVLDQSSTSEIMVIDAGGLRNASLRSACDWGQSDTDQSEFLEGNYESGWWGAFFDFERQAPLVGPRWDAWAADEKGCVYIGGQVTASSFEFGGTIDPVVDSRLHLCNACLQPVIVAMPIGLGPLFNYEGDFGPTWGGRLVSSIGESVPAPGCADLGGTRLDGPYEVRLATGRRSLWVQWGGVEPQSVAGGFSTEEEASMFLYIPEIVHEVVDGYVGDTSRIRDCYDGALAYYDEAQLEAVYRALRLGERRETELLHVGAIPSTTEFMIQLRAFVERHEPAQHEEP